MSGNADREAFEKWREQQDNSILRAETAWQTIERAYQTARAEYAGEVALALHDRDVAERNHARIAADNMRLKEEIERLKRVVEQVRAHAAATNNIIERKCRIVEICDKALAATEKEGL